VGGGHLEVRSCGKYAGEQVEGCNVSVSIPQVRFQTLHRPLYTSRSLQTQVRLTSTRFGDNVLTATHLDAPILHLAIVQCALREILIRSYGPSHAHVGSVAMSALDERHDDVTISRRKGGSVRREASVSRNWCSDLCCRGVPSERHWTSRCP
jgi:hypothetical protein